MVNLLYHSTIGLVKYGYVLDKLKDEQYTDTSCIHTASSPMNIVSRLKSFHAGNTYRRIRTSRRVNIVQTFLRKNPFRSFLLALGFVLLILILGNIVTSLTKKEEKEPVVVKDVNVYQIGSAPTVRMQGRVQESGVVTIVAQSPGIVNTIHADEGERVGKGTWLVSLASNYQGGNAQALQAQLAQTQYNNVKDTFDTQKGLIQKQREVAEKTSENSEELRQISEAARNESESLLRQNEAILQTLEASLGLPGVDEAQTRQLIAQTQAGVSQLRNATNSLNYQSNPENPPTDLANLQKDIALQQLHVQEKALDLQREVSRIQLNLAYVAESVMHPASPFVGTVERIHVTEGQSVAPGTTIATVTADDNEITATVFVPREIANGVSSSEMSTLTLGKRTYKTAPYYVSKNATDGQLYSVLYTIPTEYAHDVTSGSSISVDIPVGKTQTTSAIPFVPIDAVYQTQEQAYVYIVKNKKAESRKITLGSVYGRYVEVADGLEDQDQVITNRNVLAGEQVNVIH